MRTLQQDIDDLDRMVDTGAAKHEIRSQIRLISREVAVLQAKLVSLAESHTKLADAEKKRRDALGDAIRTMGDNHLKTIRSRELRHDS